MWQAIRDWRWLQWLVVMLVAGVVVVEVVERQTQRVKRLSASNMQHIESRIVEYKTMAEKLVHSAQLPEVKQQWKYVEAISSHYGVTLHKATGGNLKGFYKGPLDAWSGSLQGSVGAVLVAAQQLQETVPTNLYQFTLANGQMTLAFSVLGSNAHE